MAQKTIFELDLLSIVRARSHLTIAAVTIWIFVIALIISTANSAANPSPLLIAINFISLGVVIWVLVATILLQVAMGIGVPTIVLTAIVTLFLPMLVPLAVLVSMVER